MDSLTELPEKPVIKPPQFLIDNQFTFDPVAQWQTLGYTLFTTQKQVLNTTAKVCLFQGGYACGKTHVAVLFGLQQAFKQAGSQGIVLAQHSATLTDSLMPEYNRLLTMLGLVNGQHYVVRKTARCIVLKNGSVIQFRTVRQQWQTLNADWAQIERLSDIKNPDAFNTLLARLNKTGARLLATTLPDANHWMNDAFNTTSPLFTTVVGKTMDNPTLDPSYLAIMQTVLTPIQQASLLYGLTPNNNQNLLHYLTSQVAQSEEIAEKMNSVKKTVLDKNRIAEQVVNPANENNFSKNSIKNAVWESPTRLTVKKPVQREHPFCNTF